MEYKDLFTPMKLNGLTLKNRIVAAPIGEEFSSKALGGAGLVICGHTVVEPGRSSFASGDEQSAFFKYEVENTQAKIRQCHMAGARASIEIFHAGLYARVTKGNYAVGPCAFVREDGVEVKALDKEEMDKIADLYVDAVKQARSLGFDAVFLHFGHGWLPAQFISPLFNHRTDEFGGSIENRSKFPLMIIKRIREAVGPYFPIEMRISGEECVPGSIEFKDTLQFTKYADEYVDGIQISAGLDINHEGNVRMATTNLCEHMPNVKWAKEVKKAMKHAKVSVVGAVMNPNEANSLIKNGDVDYVAFGRSFIADPNWPNKAMNDNAEDIVPCIRCLQCYHISTNRRNVGCSVNPHYHNESFLPKELKMAEKVKTIVVVGAGPAGISAAVTASKRGHKVILLDKNDKVGGTVRVISQERYKEDIKYYLTYLETQVAKSNVELHLNTTATKEEVMKYKPDALILAIGAQPIMPPIEGIDNANVMGFKQAIENPESVGKNVVIIGGGTIGAEIALELAEDNKKVSVVEMTDTIAAQGNMLYRIALRQKFENLENKVEFLKEHRCTKITGSSVVVFDKENNEKDLNCDTVIIATGVRVDRKQVDSFYDIVPETYEVGDTILPRKIQEAVFEGTGVGSII